MIETSVERGNIGKTIDWRYPQKVFAKNKNEKSLVKGNQMFPNIKLFFDELLKYTFFTAIPNRGVALTIKLYANRCG